MAGRPTEAAARFLRERCASSRIADWDLHNPSFREKIQCVWHAKDDDDAVTVLADLQLREWIQSFAAQSSCLLLFANDDALLQFLTKAVHESVVDMNDASTSIGDLWSGGAGVAIAVPHSMFDVPRVLLETLSQSSVGPSWTGLSLDQQQRRYDAFFLYLLCHVASKLWDYKQSNSAAPYSLAEWQQFFQDHVWRYTSFSYSSDLVKTMVALFWFDQCLTSERRRIMPYDLGLEALDTLLYAERRENRLETISEVTQLEYYVVAGVLADRLITVYPHDEYAWTMARRWYSAHVSASFFYMEQLKKQVEIPTTNATPEDRGDHALVYPFLVDIKVSCHFPSPLRWHSAIRLAFDLTELDCLSQDDKTDVWQCVYRELLWNDYPVLFYNYYYKEPEFRMQTIDFLLAAPRSSLALHVLMHDLMAFRDDVQAHRALPTDVRSYLDRLVLQTLWRLVLRQYTSLHAIPAEYRTLLCSADGAVDDATRERRVRQRIQDALPLPATWCWETLDDHWSVVFETLATSVEEKVEYRPEERMALPTAVVGHVATTEKEQPIPSTARVLNLGEVEHLVEKQDENHEMEEDVAMEEDNEPTVKSPEIRGNRPDVPMEEDDDLEEGDDDEVASDEESDAQDEADVAMDDESEDDEEEDDYDDEEEEEKEKGAPEVFDVDDSSDESRRRSDEDSEHPYEHFAGDDAEVLEDETTETESDQSEQSSTSSQPREDDRLLDVEDQEEEEEEEEEDDYDEDDDDDTEHPKSIASSYHGSELTDRMRDGQDPDDNEAGYDGEESQDAATEEENEDHYIAGRPSLEESTPGASSLPEANSLLDAVPVVPIVTHNEASTLVDKGYEPDSQGQTDVEGVPQPLRIMEAGYDAEDSQGHTEDDEVFDEEDDQPLLPPDHFPSIHSILSVSLPANGSPRVPPHVPRHTLSTDDMIADDEAESSEIEGDGYVEPTSATKMPFEGGNLLMQVATSVQNEHFLTQPATPSQESHPPTLPSMNNDQIESDDENDEVLEESATDVVVETSREVIVETTTEMIVETASEMIVESAAERIVETATEMIVETATEMIVETATEMIVETATEMVVESATDVIVEAAIEANAEGAADAIGDAVTDAIGEVATDAIEEAATDAIGEVATDATGQTTNVARMDLEIVEYHIPEADEESESSDSVRSHPGDEISCPVSVASSPQSSVGMESAAKPEAVSPPTNMTGKTVLTTPQREQNLSPKAQSMKKTPVSATSSKSKSKIPTVRVLPPVTRLSDTKRKRAPPERLEATEDARKPAKRARTRASGKEESPAQPSRRVSTRAAAKKPSESPSVAEMSQLASRSRATAAKPPETPATVETPQRALRSRATAKKPSETPATARSRATATKPQEDFVVDETPQRAARSRATATKPPEAPVVDETPQRALRNRATATKPPEAPVVHETPQRALRNRATATKPSEAPVVDETPQRALRSRAAAKLPPRAPVADETPQRAARSRASEKKSTTESASQRATRSRTATPEAPEETVASTVAASRETRVTRSRGAGKPPTIPTEDTKTSQRVTRSKRGA